MSPRCRNCGAQEAHHSARVVGCPGFQPILPMIEVNGPANVIHRIRDFKPDGDVKALHTYIEKELLKTCDYMRRYSEAVRHGQTPPAWHEVDHKQQPQSGKEEK